MDGIHDLGGMEGFGPVVVEPDEPVFHADWERRVWGMTMNTFVAGLSNGGEFRHSIERMDPVHYLTSPYYEHWLTGLATRAVESNVVSVVDLEAAAGGEFPLARPEQPTDQSDEVGKAASGEARFATGHEVRVVDTTTRGHTRLPRYVRHARGTVVRVDPPASLPDVEAHSSARVIEPTYCVRFTLRELWGGSEAGCVHVDLWQSYLEPA